MKTSARNQFPGTITAVDIGPATALATLAAAAGFEVVASMTAATARKLALAPGQPGLALVKSSSVVLVADFAGHALSARNQLAGTVSQVERGAVSSVVTVALPGGAVVTATVTNDAVAALGLALGQAVTAAFKASAVMLAVPA